ncbi:hypothetical protein HOLleu_45119 [Holothuria leucospilota]|uniref:C2H2-type domain-containing protein n=1 Tax=Holothuria leucospilota TaxID=206669 RepID=A0A9Q0YBU3_HOLLE|nr:hypothetical protein HOLleu_45119 [Holothuria leucospilota]
MRVDEPASLASEPHAHDHSYADSSFSSESESSVSLDCSDGSTDSDTEARPVTSTPRKKQSVGMTNHGISPGADAVIEQIKCLSESELCEVAKFLGETQASNIRSDTHSLSKMYHNLDYISNLNIEDWLRERNQVLVNFVKGTSKLTDPLDTKTQYCLAKSVEQVYGLQSTKHVFPLSFSENAVTYSVVNSKLAANMGGLSAPSGSYWTIRQWLDGQASQPMPSPQGDCICAFDNDQVIGKTYHVRANQKLKTSVITSVCVAEVDKSGALQMQKHLKPANWLNNVFDESQILDYDSQYHKQLSDLHYKEVYKALQVHIEKVQGEITSGGGNFSDEIDRILTEQQFAREWKVCFSCKHTNPKTKRLCENCKVPLKATCETHDQTSEAFPPQRVYQKTVKEINFMDKTGQASSSLLQSDESTSAEPIKVTPRDPVFVNPNSFETVKEVFLEIGKDFKVAKYTNSSEESKREWLLVVCDGVPYTIGQKVVKETFRCPQCGAVIFGKDSFEEHCMASHNSEKQNMEYPLEFDWVHLKIGYGHYEMNMLRSFFSLNWDVMVKDLAFAMGFRTENAQRYAKNGSDHHKSWELLCILYEGTLDELLYPYVTSCLESGEVPTPTGYLEWSQGVKSPKYQYLQEQILTYVQGILNFRKGVRYNDKDMILAGKYKHAPVFHARNHPKYQLIELNEARNDIIMPSDVKKFVHDHQSINRSGHSGRGEDMDFQLENLNKRSKVWTPKGVPSESDWLRTFRNLEKLDKASTTFAIFQMRSETLQRMGCEDPKRVAEASSHTPQKEEVVAWRTALRESRFLTTPLNECIMESVSGEPLDDQLVNLTSLAWSRRRYMYSILFKGASNLHLPDPIFVLPQEREAFHDIKNQTKDVIATKVKLLIDQIQDENVRFDLLESWSSVQRQKKDDYLLFYDKVKEEVNAANVELNTGATDVIAEEDV